MGTIRMRVDQLLAQKGMSITELSRRAGINYRTAFEIAKGRYQRIGLETLARICDALEVEPGEIFEYSRD